MPPISACSDAEIAERDAWSEYWLREQVVSLKGEAQALKAELASLREDNLKEITSLHQQIERRMERYSADMNRAQEQHAADIARIGEAMLAEAEARDWCGQYDDFVDNLNVKLDVALPTRNHDYDVVIPITITVRVTARDEDGARHNAQDLARDLEREIDRLDDVATSSWPFYDGDFKVEET